MRTAITLFGPRFAHVNNNFLLYMLLQWMGMGMVHQSNFVDSVWPWRVSTRRQPSSIPTTLGPGSDYNCGRICPRVLRVRPRIYLVVPADSVWLCCRLEDFLCPRLFLCQFQ